MCEVFKCKIGRSILTPYFTKCEWKLTRTSITISSITTSINILTIINIITIIVHYHHLLWSSWSRSTPSERILRSAFCQPRSIDLSQPKSSHTLDLVDRIVIIIIIIVVSISCTGFFSTPLRGKNTIRDACLTYFTLYWNTKRWR